jgi:transcriptional regulator of nitric oxide reductase
MEEACPGVKRNQRDSEAAPDEIVKKRAATFTPMLTLTLAACAALVLGAQPAPSPGKPIDARSAEQLKQLFPSATSFAPKGGEPPHFKAYVTDAATGAATLAGLAFWTTELEPLERGYDGPIKILVGLDPAGRLTGVVVADHHEPYGYFSVDLPEFAAQFKGKSIRDPFRLGADVAAVSRATMTVGSATRAVRNSARRVATALLKPPQ